MENQTALIIEGPQDAADRTWLSQLWEAEWGGPVMISKGQTYHLNDMSALIAWHKDVRVGAATYYVHGPDCELVSINASSSGLGVGTALLSAVETLARDAACRRVWLITTNDNLGALRFYQKRGYRICAIYPGAVDEARKQKPAIPLFSEDGIPIRDELELEKVVPGLNCT